MLRLIEQGKLTLSTSARSLLGDDLPLIADDVTIEHLLGHRSGIGDYLDEETDLSLSDYLMPVSVHRLATTTDFLPRLRYPDLAGTAGTPLRVEPTQVRATNGTFTVSPPLPHGLTLDPKTGMIAGTPTAPGTTRRRIGLRDTTGATSAADRPSAARSSVSTGFFFAAMMFGSFG